MVKLSANFGIIKGEIGKMKTPHTYNSPPLHATYLKHSPELCRLFQNVKQVIPSSKSEASTHFHVEITSFQKYPMFLEKLFKYNRNSERSGCELNLQCRINKVTTCHGFD